MLVVFFKSFLTFLHGFLVVLHESRKLNLAGLIFVLYYIFLGLVCSVPLLSIPGSGTARPQRIAMGADVVAGRKWEHLHRRNGRRSLNLVVKFRRRYRDNSCEKHVLEEGKHATE
jgi:hypothetical protein